YPYPPVECQRAAAMDTAQSHRPSIAPQSVISASPEAMETTPTSKKTTPFDANFGLHLADHNIHKLNSMQKPDLAELLAALARPRKSPSLSNFSDSDFDTFVENVLGSSNIHDVLTYVISTILGPRVSSYDTAQNVLFENMQPITDETVAVAKPQLYDGASPVLLSKHVRDQLSNLIIPSIAEGTPVVPNFFLEVAEDNSLKVAKLQARYHGAIGARAMHSLQNFGKKVPEYDGKWYTYSSSYLSDGFIQIYAHHVTRPALNGLMPDYKMTL
ncbi:hypothetical protein SEPCBS119000_006772, partial [Sporothrix epigloea]